METVYETLSIPDSEVLYDHCEYNIREVYPLALLTVENLKTYFHTDFGLVKAVDGVSYEINEGEIVGLLAKADVANR